MGWLIALIIGGLVGWLMSATAAEERHVVSVPAGIIAGALGGLAGPAFFGNLLHLHGALTNTLGNISFLGFLWSLIGSLIFAGISLGVITWPRFTRREAASRSYAREYREKDERR